MVEEYLMIESDKSIKRGNVFLENELNLDMFRGMEELLEFLIEQDPDIRELKSIANASASIWQIVEEIAEMKKSNSFSSSTAFCS